MVYINNSVINMIYPHIHSFYYYYYYFNNIFVLVLFYDMYNKIFLEEL